MRNQTLIVDINKETCKVLKYKQYDNNNLLQIIVEKDDERVSLNGYTGYAFFKLPSGLIIKKDCSIQGSEVTINIDNNILSESGKIALDLTLSDGNKTFTLFRINLVIEESIDKDDAIIVEAGWDIVSEIAKINKRVESLDGVDEEDLDELNNKINDITSQLERNTSQIEEIINGGNNTDLSGYATKDELNGKADKTEINSVTSRIAMLESQVNNLNERLTLRESQINALRSDVDRLLQNNGGGNSGDNISCTSISIIPEAYTFTSIGQEYKLSANVTPSNTTDKILWSTTNSAIAQVTNGMVTSIGNGECIIIATCGNYSDTCLITVNIEDPDNPDTPVEPVVPPTSSGIILNMYSVALSKTNNEVELVATISQSGSGYFSWSCSNEFIASTMTLKPDTETQSYLTLTPSGDGICIVTVTYGDYSATCTVTVSGYGAPADGSSVPCESVKLSYPTADIEDTFHIYRLGEFKIVNIELEPSYTTDEVTLSYDTSKIHATLNQSDDTISIVPLATGTTTLTATCNGKTSSISISIEEVDGCVILYKLNNVTLSNTTKIVPLGSTYQSKVTPASGYSIKSLKVINESTNLLIDAYDSETSSICIDNVTSDIVIRIDAEVSSGNTVQYTSPTVTLDNYKAKVTQNGYTEYFDVSYEPNMYHENYGDTVELIDASDNKYYLSLLFKGDSKFNINGLYPNNGGWTSDLDQGGALYAVQNSYVEGQNWNFTYTVKNLNNSIPSDFLNKILEIYSSALPALNVTVSSSSINEMSLEELQESWLGVCYCFSSDFKIVYNSYSLGNSFGTCSVNNNRWISTGVHELGHTLGLPDQASHLPSIMDYGRDYYTCTYLQPNDIYTLEKYAKEKYNINIRESQANINSALSKSNVPVTISENSENNKPRYYFDYYHYNNDEIAEGSDVVISCTLNFNRKETISMGSMNIDYNIYDISLINTEKGQLENYELKIQDCLNIDIDNNNKYKLYLKQYDTVPCSLINPFQGIEKL